MQVVNKIDQKQQTTQYQPQHSKRLESILLSKNYSKRKADTAQEMDSRMEAEIRLEKLFKNLI